MLDDTPEWVRTFLEEQRVARLATVDETGRPHVLPIVYAWDGERLYTPIDTKPKRAADPMQLQRVRNIQANPKVAVVVDYYDDDWRQLAWVQLRGKAAILTDGRAHSQAIARLRSRYAQYATVTLDERPIIVIDVERITFWKYTL